MEKFVYATNTSSTASGPPSPKGKALERDLFFGLLTEVRFVTATTSGRRDVDPYRFCGIFIVLNNRRMCSDNRYDLGRPVVAPTIKKECRRMCSGDRYDLGRIISSPTILLFIFHHSSFIIHFLPVGEAISLPKKAGWMICFRMQLKQQNPHPKPSQ